MMGEYKKLKSAGDLRAGELVVERDGYAFKHDTIFMQDDICEECGGTGEVHFDESDGEGHIMRGTGTQKCICQLDDTEQNQP